MAPGVEMESQGKKDAFADALGSGQDKFTGVISVATSASSRKILVDMRELRSSLPFILYKNGFTLEPITLDIGDYILSSNLCIERKSTSDLISSLNSGRLFSQVEQMSRYYAHPLLLIEFDENKPFSLLPTVDVRSEISISDISSKLCLLLIHFPMLKIMWSCSLAATTDMFADLRRGDETEPVAMGPGTLRDSGGEAQSQSESMDPVAKDLLLSMPGITHLNYHNITRHVRDLRHLAQLNQSAIEDLIGTENGCRLYNFLHQPIALQR